MPALVALTAAAAERWQLVPVWLRWPMAAAIALPLFNYTTGDQALSYRGSLLEPLSRPLVNGVAIQVALALCILACLRRPVALE